MLQSDRTYVMFSRSKRIEHLLQEPITKRTLSNSITIKEKVIKQ